MIRMNHQEIETEALGNVIVLKTVSEPKIFEFVLIYPNIFEEFLIYIIRNSLLVLHAVG